MKLPDAIAPYATLLKWILIALLALGLFGSGCSVQKSRDAEKLAKADRAIDLRTEALHAAATALRKARNTFQDISHRTQESAAAAKAVREAGQRLADQAAKDRLKHQRETARLEKLLEEERSKCTDGRRPICGIPLR